jgi:DNA-binding ferritin-like protein
MLWSLSTDASPREPAVRRSQVYAQQALSEARATEELMALLDQSLADTLELAFQIERAHWSVDGLNTSGLRPVFEAIHRQLAVYIDDLDQRVDTLGSRVLRTLSAADQTSMAAVDPMAIRNEMTVLNDLVDHCGEYSGRIRTAGRMAERLGDRNTAAFCKSVSLDMDRTLWMLTSIQVA